MGYYSLINDFGRIFLEKANISNEKDEASGKTKNNEMEKFHHKHEILVLRKMFNRSMLTLL